MCEPLSVYIGMTTFGNKVHIPITGKKGNTMISGMTGAGKSTLLQAMLQQLINTESTTKLELHFVDYKGIEFDTFVSTINNPNVSCTLQHVTQGISAKEVYNNLNSILVSRQELLQRGVSLEDLPRSIVIINEMHLRGKQETYVSQKLLSMGAELGINTIMISQQPFNAMELEDISYFPNIIGLRLHESISQKLLGTDICKTLVSYGECYIKSENLSSYILMHVAIDAGK